MRVVKQEVIAPANSTHQELETVSQVLVTPKIEGAIATSVIPQEQVSSISEPQVSRGISLPVVPLSAKGEPIIPKKLTQTELDAMEDEIKRLRINPDSCISVIKKYWDNVQGAMPTAGASPSLELRKRFSRDGVASPQDYSLTAAIRGLSLRKAR